ncbi:shikimate kinase [Halalkalibacter kiskunsagensis]|uniref:Shikimate kinase n=1 Tax=Halalkalibacter kiskunsagensis TaxID=1548599 RepID=A0ABV6KFK9_9BACI
MSNFKMFPKEKSIVFIGFMGVGKTTIGKLVAQNLNRSFIDIDEEIEKEYKMPTTEIFKTIGEKAFREKEKALITKFCSQKSIIISVGGGAFLQKEVREVCLSNCTVIALDISWEQWKERLDKIIDSRPVLKGLSMEEIEALFYKRKEIYVTHHLKFTTDHLTEEEVANDITESLKPISELNDSN